jgi:hypothetical protein
VEVANAARNAAWFTVFDSPPMVRVAYPADEAVRALVNTIKGYGRAPRGVTRLRRPLARALKDLAAGRLALARGELTSFRDLAEGQRATLGDERTDDLRDAALNIVVALSD